MYTGNVEESRERNRKGQKEGNRGIERSFMTYNDDVQQEIFKGWFLWIGTL